MRAGTAARGGAGQSSSSRAAGATRELPVRSALAPSTAPVSRRWLLLVGAIALVLTFAQAPGQVSPDTKLDLTANPLRFLARATNLWNSELPFGQAQNQAYGYLFPHGTPAPPRPRSASRPRPPRRRSARTRRPSPLRCRPATSSPSC